MKWSITNKWKKACLFCYIGLEWDVLHIPDLSSYFGLVLHIPEYEVHFRVFIMTDKSCEHEHKLVNLW